MKDFSRDEKLTIIAESESDSTTKSAICRKYGICTNTLLYWKKTMLPESPEEKENVRMEAKEIFDENIRLRSIIIDREIEIQVLKELVKKGDQRKKIEKK